MESSSSQSDFQHVTVTGTVDIKLADLDECYPEDKPTQTLLNELSMFGPTGAGKSTFIEQFSSSHSLHISKNSLESVTQTIVLYEILNITIGGRTVLLLDTPGFSDTKISEDYVLGEVNHYLDISMLSAAPTQMLFFERITDTRKAGSSRRVIKMFKIFTDSFSQRDITIVTSMWNQLVSEEKGMRRLQQLETEFWPEIIQQGAKTAKFECTLQSALAVLDSGVERIMNGGPISRGNFAVTRAYDKTYSELIDLSLGGRIESLHLQLKMIEDNLGIEEIRSDEMMRAQLEKEREEALMLIRKFGRQLEAYVKAATQAGLGNPVPVKREEDWGDDEEEERQPECLRNTPDELQQEEVVHHHAPTVIVAASKVNGPRGAFIGKLRLVSKNIYRSARRWLKFERNS
ncbi:hypothetical protein CVT24_012101 [Panaeolus cyanescens]|uniref:G domain-containing protein n=1 Tax=Panaeolus cyanescens TaxID=181874 RepID=A0A409WWY4_9AGAR|nr:hypothetical protein CVT24_012101 [Panaeolus cyanescens]